MRATLKQVAKDTDLSIATVSRALRRKKRRYSVNEEKIYAAARKLGYPFIGNDNIQDTSSIALVAEIHEGEFYSSLFYGFNAASKNSNSDVIFVNAATDLEDPVNFITDLSKKYSGICLFLPSLSKNNYSKIKDSVGSYPIVSVVSGKNLKIDSISFDSYSGGYMVAKHFQERTTPDTALLVSSVQALENISEFLDEGQVTVPIAAEAVKATAALQERKKRYDVQNKKNGKVEYSTAQLAQLHLAQTRAQRTGTLLARIKVFSDGVSALTKPVHVRIHVDEDIEHVRVTLSVLDEMADKLDGTAEQVMGLMTDTYGLLEDIFYLQRKPRKLKTLIFLLLLVLLLHLLVLPLLVLPLLLPISLQVVLKALLLQQQLKWKVHL